LETTDEAETAQYREQREVLINRVASFICIMVSITYRCHRHEQHETKHHASTATRCPETCYRSSSQERCHILSFFISLIQIYQYSSEEAYELVSLHYEAHNIGQEGARGHNGDDMDSIQSVQVDKKGGEDWWVVGIVPRCSCTYQLLSPYVPADPGIASVMGVAATIGMLAPSTSRCIVASY
jgi:hypothetical protein